MSRVVGWTRRAVLRLLSAAGLGLALRSSGKRFAHATPKEDPTGKAWANLLRGGDSALRVGADYLRRQPDEADAGRLRRLLGLAASDLPGEPGPSEIAALAARHREDFRAGRVVQLDGWVLSVTELRLAALIWLSRTP